MSEQHKITQALNSVEKAHNAVGEAVDHPSSLMIDQAEHSLIHAAAAVHQARESGAESASLNSAAAQLEEDRSTLGSESLD